MIRRLQVLLFLLGGLAAWGPLAACPLCKETVAEESGELSASYNTSTLLMLGVLFSLAGFTAILFARAARSSVRPAVDVLAGQAAPPGAEPERVEVGAAAGSCGRT